MDRRLSAGMDNLRQKAGYLDVKQPAKTRGIKVKPWRKRWICVHQMSDLAARKTLARLDIYADEEASTKPHSEKTTIILENITAVRRTKSRTHPYAFEIVDTEPRLCLSGSSEADTQSWIILLRHILWPPRPELPPPLDSFEVSLIDNRDSHRLQLSGNYWLTVSSSGIMLFDTIQRRTVQSWRLNSLMRFFLATTPEDKDMNHILVIQAGPMAETGAGEYLFYTPRATQVLQLIMVNIKQAMAIRQAKDRKHMSQGGHRERTLSTTSSVLRYKTILDRSQDHDVDEVDEGSLSSNQDDSSISPTSPGNPWSFPPPTQFSPPKAATLPTVIASSSTSTAEYNRIHFSPPDHVIETHHRPQTMEGVSKTLGKAEMHGSHSVDSFSKSDVFPVDDFPMDEDGYSHLSAPDAVVMRCDKTRTVSVSSTVSKASGSVTSRDSGIVFSADNKPFLEESDDSKDDCRDTSNSFDSAMSTSGPTEEHTAETELNDRADEDTHDDSLESNPVTVVDPTEKHMEIVITEETFGTDVGDVDNRKISTVSNIYSDISESHSRKVSSVSNIYADIEMENKRREEGQMRRSHSLDKLKGENDYEELDSFRKDLGKHLGFDPLTDTKDTPPALPERPKSIQVKRRQANPPTPDRHEKPRHKHDKRTSKSAGIFAKSRDPRKSSSSSSEDDDVNKLILQVNSWPLESLNSVTDANDLYQSSKDTAVYDEITKSSDQNEDIPVLSKTERDLLMASPPFDLHTIPPVSSTVAWSGVDLLTSSPKRCSPIVDGVDLLTSSPTRCSPILDMNLISPANVESNINLFDSSWPPSDHRGSLELPIDHSLAPAERRRSSTFSCPCSDERCSNRSSDHLDNRRTPTRSFNEDLLIPRSSMEHSHPNTSNDVYESMDRSQSPGSNRSGKQDGGWADFSALDATSQTNSKTDGWADFSFFSKPISRQNSPDRNQSKNNSADLMDLIAWDSQPLCDTLINPDSESTYMDMSSSAPSVDVFTPTPWD